MHVGLYLAPQTSGEREDLANIEAIVEQAVEADEAGFSTIYLTEHHFDDYNTYGDSIILGAHLAGKIKRAWLATSVSLVTLHHPVRLVESFNLLDALCRGRVIFGLAGGGGPAMYEGLGRDPELRRDALDQTIEAMLRIWARTASAPPLELETVYDRARLTGRVMPAPYRRPHPYLARATNSDATMRAFAERGWPVMLGRLPADRMGQATRLYRSALEGAGHPPDTVRWCVQWMASTKMVYVGATDEQARAEAEGPMRRYFELIGRTFHPGSNTSRFGGLDGSDVAREARSYEEFIQAAWLVGSPETVLKGLKAYEAEGVPQMRLWFTFGPGCPHEYFRRSFHLFVREVLPQLRPEPIWDPQPQTTISGLAATAS